MDKMERKWHTDLYKVSELNWEEEARKDVEARESVRIYDCTLREIYGKAVDPAALLEALGA